MNDPGPGFGKGADVYARRRLKAIAARWDARAETWDQMVADPDCHLNEDDAYRRFVRVLQHQVRLHRPVCAAQGVIDLGCGTGLVLAAVVRHFAWGVGVDLSPQMIRCAQAKLIPNTTFLVGDGFQLAQLCPPAGAVVARGVLLSHYGPEQGLALLAAVRATLLPGGWLVCDFLNAAARAQARHVPEAKTWYAAKEIQALAHEAGFAHAACVGSRPQRVLTLVAELAGPGGA